MYESPQLGADRSVLGGQRKWWVSRLFECLLNQAPRLSGFGNSEKKNDGYGPFLRIEELSPPQNFHIFFAQFFFSQIFLIFFSKINIM